MFLFFPKTVVQNKQKPPLKPIYVRNIPECIHIIIIIIMCANDKATFLPSDPNDGWHAVVVRRVQKRI